MGGVDVSGGFLEIWGRLWRKHALQMTGWCFLMDGRSNSKLSFDILMSESKLGWPRRRWASWRRWMSESEDLDLTVSWLMVEGGGSAERLESISISHYDWCSMWRHSPLAHRCTMCVISSTANGSLVTSLVVSLVDRSFHCTADRDISRSCTTSTISTLD